MLPLLAALLLAVPAVSQPVAIPFSLPAFHRPTFPSAAGPLVAMPPDGRLILQEELYRRLAAQDLVFIGEGHNLAAHHALQAEVLKTLQARRPGIALGLEMLDVTQQGTLEAWRAGRMSDGEFAAFWRKAWGYPFELYKPLLEQAKAGGSRLLALNAPQAVVRQVAKGGLASLTPEQRALLPAEIRPISDPRYLEYVRRSLREHGPMPPEQEARMLEAMAVWNETMGQSLADALQAGPLVVAAGLGHVLYGAGILESVRSRAPARQAAVLPYPLDGARGPAEEVLRALRTSGDLQLADFFWILAD